MSVGAPVPTHGSSPLTRGKHECRHYIHPPMGLIPAHAGKTCHCCPGSPHSRAHPRSRGENGVADSCLTALPGSSPLTRGKQTVGLDQVTPQRLIPAHAGKTRRHPGDCCRGEAHPRSRGENGKGVNVAQPRVGSSPLTRGKRRQSATHIWVRGLIPAHAGKT